MENLTKDCPSCTKEIPRQVFYTHTDFIKQTVDKILTFAYAIYCNKYINAVNGESILLELGREGVSLGESIPEGKIIEVHPGAGSVNNI